MRPIFCHKCGRKLRTMVTHKYDVMTGEKMVDSTAMECPKEFTHTHYLYIGGVWTQLW